MPPKARTPAGIPRDETEALLQLAAQYGVTELEVAWGDSRIRIRRETGNPTASPAPARAQVETVARGVAHGSHLVTIETPMVGTFYRAPAPDASPYVNEGEAIKEGQIVCVIEAMKLMNEIEAKVAGRVVKILVENGQSVEYGQPLFLVDPLS